METRLCVLVTKPWPGTASAQRLCATLCSRLPRREPAFSYFLKFHTRLRKALLPNLLHQPSAVGIFQSKDLDAQTKCVEK